jgi:hypothetical protein
MRCSANLAPECLALGRKIAGCGQTQGELNYGRIAKSKKKPPHRPPNAVKRIPLPERGILMEPEFENNEVPEGATLKQWRRPVLRRLAISATEASKASLNEGGGGGKGDAGPGTS